MYNRFYAKIERKPTQIGQAFKQLFTIGVTKKVSDARKVNDHQEC